MEDVDRVMRILVVDDEQLVRWFLERALKKWGHEVVTASNVDEALGMIDGRGFDLLFTDLRMPERSGADLLERLSEIKGKQPKVIVCSAFITADMASDLRSRGYLTLKKPFKLSELQDTMRQCEDGVSSAEG